MYDPHTDIMNEVYLKKAYIYASRSQDPSTQNGAILIHPEKGIVLGASNSLVEGSHDDVWSSERKYHYVEHAERNVLYKAARRGIPTVGLTLCCPWFACSDCARAIVQCGIKKVIGHKNIRVCLSTLERVRGDWTRYIRTCRSDLRVLGKGCWRRSVYH